MYYFIKSISFLMCKLSFKTVDIIATVLGTLMYVFMLPQRFTARMNLTLVFPDKKYNEISEIIRRNFKEIALTFFEILRLPLLDANVYSESFKHINSQYLEEAKSQDGVIFIGCHSGNWETVNIITPHIMKYMVIVKRQKNAGFNRFLTEMRQKSGTKVVFDDDLRSITKYLKDNYSIAIMYDHGFKNSPMFTSFCNMDVQVPKSAFTLARKYNRKLFPVYFTREEQTNVIKYFKPLILDRDDPTDQAQMISDIFARELVDNPYYYLWSYKRFKRSVSKRITVLSDSKPGHVNQSISLAKIIESEFSNSRTTNIYLKISRFKRIICDFIVITNLVKLLSRKLWILNFLLPAEFEKLIRYTDVVISTGSSLSSVNKIISTVLNCKSVVIMKPNVSPKLFTAVFLPAHDFSKLFYKSNIVKITGALKFAEQQLIEDDSSKFISKFNLSKDSKYLSVLIGGPLPGAIFDADTIKDNLLAIQTYAKKNALKILMTTSRRTPQWLELFIKTEFSNVSALIIANEENYDYVINGILGNAEVVISTADSVSMITEAATYRPTLIVDLFNTLKCSRKHNKFVNNLVDDRQAMFVDNKSSALQDSLEMLLSSCINLKLINNEKIVRDAIKGLF